MNARLKERSLAALLAGARSVSTVDNYDSLGYAAHWKKNLMPGLPLAEIEHDLRSGAGKELERKLCAAHSSAALVVNAFGPWRVNPVALRLAGATGFRKTRFEAVCPTGLGGTPPHLDLLAEGEAIVAVESKCTEWMNPTKAQFSTSYDRLQGSHGHSPWYELIQQLRSKPDRYQFLDAAQLVKHALGLLSCIGSRRLKLVYLYWEPRNAVEWDECRCHRAEAAELAGRVASGSVQLVPMSYGELWRGWTTEASSPHLAYLGTRYDREA